MTDKKQSAFDRLIEEVEPKEFHTYLYDDRMNPILDAARKEHADLLRELTDLRAAVTPFVTWSKDKLVNSQGAHFASKVTTSITGVSLSIEDLLVLVRVRRGMPLEDAAESAVTTPITFDELGEDPPVGAMPSRESKLP